MLTYHKQIDKRTTMKNQNRSAALGRPAMKLLGGFNLFAVDQPILVWSSPGALAEDAGSCRLLTVRDSLCGRGMMFGHWFPPHVSAPQSSFYHDPNPVGILFSAHGNLRVFEYTV